MRWNESRCSMTCETFSSVGIGSLPSFTRLFWNASSIHNSMRYWHWLQQTKVPALSVPQLVVHLLNHNFLLQSIHSAFCILRRNSDRALPGRERRREIVE